MMLSKNGDQEFVYGDESYSCDSISPVDWCPGCCVFLMIQPPSSVTKYELEGVFLLSYFSQVLNGLSGRFIIEEKQAVRF